MSSSSSPLVQRLMGLSAFYSFGLRLMCVYTSNMWGRGHLKNAFNLGMAVSIINIKTEQIYQRSFVFILRGFYCF